MHWGADNHNVILHEFAHVLDQADDATAQSIPVAVDSLVDRVKWNK
jgi:Mlc titration factor MtfA (ptsG expression regulator)